MKGCVNKLETLKDLEVNSEIWYDQVYDVRAAMLGVLPHYLTSEKETVRTKMASTNIRNWLLTGCTDDALKKNWCKFKLWRKPIITYKSKNHSILRFMKKSFRSASALEAETTSTWIGNAWQGGSNQHDRKHPLGLMWN